VTSKTDIVDRLRQCLKANAGIGGNVVLYSPVKDDDIREAADEIERLRVDIGMEKARAEREAILARSIMSAIEYLSMASITSAIERRCAISPP
jgi:hypothetical protein